MTWLTNCWAAVAIFVLQVLVGVSSFESVSLSISHSTTITIRRTKTVIHSPIMMRKEAQPNNHFRKIVALLHPGEGQRFGGRKELHDSGALRSIFDVQIYTHIPFFYAIYLSYRNHLYDLFLLLIISIPLSIVYHVTYERPGILASIEGLSAKFLFLYGFIQLFFAKSIPLIITELAFLFLTVLVFISTNLWKETLYDPWHCLMHIVPAFWAAVVATYHAPIIHF